MNKQDFLRECMSGFGIVPHDEFKKAYCLRCLNQECAWSVGATTSFVHRVQTWKERLFDKVDRASEDDPKYADIRAKKFLPMTPGLGSVNTGFVSPNMPTPEPVNFIPPVEEPPITVPELDLPTGIDNSLEEDEPPLTEPNPNVLMEPKEEEITKPENILLDLDSLQFKEAAEEVTEEVAAITPAQTHEKVREEPKEATFGMVQNTNFQQGMMLGEAKEEKIIPAGGTVILDDE